MEVVLVHEMNILTLEVDVRDEAKRAVIEDLKGAGRSRLQTEEQLAF